MVLIFIGFPYLRGDSTCMFLRQDFNNKYMAGINLGSSFSIISFIVGNIKHSQMAYSKVLAFVLSRLKGVVCEATLKLQCKAQEISGAYFCMVAYMKWWDLAAMGEHVQTLLVLPRVQYLWFY